MVLNKKEVAKNNFNYTYIIQWILLICVFVAGGLGFQNVWISWVGVVVSSLFVMLYYFEKGNVYFPKHSVYLGFFLLLFAVSCLWSWNPYKTFSYFLLFLGAFFFYLLFSNLKKKNPDLVDKLGNLILVLGLLFLSLFLVEQVIGQGNIGSFGLVRYSVTSLNHHHLGDFWALSVLICLYNLFKARKNNLIWTAILALGIGVLFISQSRSAFTSVLVGAVFLFGSGDVYRKYKKYTALLIAILVVLVLILGSQKSLIFAREYFIEALIGFVKHPFGIGIGNFDLISGKPEYSIFGIDAFSVVVHNVILEVLVGMGIFGVTFVFWLVKVFENVFDRAKESDLLPRVLVIALSVNFMFDYTYFIPLMNWIWFILIGTIL